MVETKEKKSGDLVTKVAEHLKNIYSLDPEQVEQMVQISATSISESLVEARQNVTAGDLVALSGQGHKVKGVLLGIGLNEEAEIARQIELNGREGKEVDYSLLIDQLEARMQPLLALCGD